jgi:hypothetical protein
MWRVHSIGSSRRRICERVCRWEKLCVRVLATGKDWNVLGDLCVRGNVHMAVNQSASRRLHPNTANKALIGTEEVRNMGSKL